MDIHIYIYIYVCVCVDIYVYIYIYIYMCVYIYIYMCVYIYIYVYIYTYTYTYTYIYTYIYTYTYIFFYLYLQDGSQALSHEGAPLAPVCVRMAPFRLIMGLRTVVEAMTVLLTTLTLQQCFSVTSRVPASSLGPVWDANAYKQSFHTAACLDRPPRRLPGQ